MFLEQLLDQSPDSPGLIFRRRPYGAQSQENLIREIIAMANAELDTPRYIVFGAESGSGLVDLIGLEEPDLDAIKQDSRTASRLIEPELQLAPIFAQVRGRQVAALEIDGCGDPPYVVRQDITERLRRGECWIRSSGQIRPAQRTDLDEMYARKRASRQAPVRVGLGDDIDCEMLELSVPDTSNPPSKQALRKIEQAIAAKKAAQQMLGRDDTAMARLVHARLYGSDVPFTARGMETLVEGFNAVEAEHKPADLFYLFEQQAIKLNLIIQNIRRDTLSGTAIEINFPRAEGFDIADHLYTDPAASASKLELELLGYPKVTKTASAIRVRASLGDLAAGSRQATFESPLRLAVGPEMRGQKVALRYTVVAHGLSHPCRGRLKLKFRR